VFMEAGAWLRFHCLYICHWYYIYIYIYMYVCIRELPCTLHALLTSHACLGGGRAPIGPPVAVPRRQRRADAGAPL